jgi:hypothetical protein
MVIIHIFSSLNAAGINSIDPNLNVGKFWAGCRWTRYFDCYKNVGNDKRMNLGA